MLRRMTARTQLVLLVGVHPAGPRLLLRLHAAQTFTEARLESFPIRSIPRQLLRHQSLQNVALNTVLGKDSNLGIDFQGSVNDLRGR